MIATGPSTARTASSWASFRSSRSRRPGGREGGHRPRLAADRSPARSTGSPPGPPPRLHSLLTIRARGWLHQAIENDRRPDGETNDMNGRTIAGVVLALVLVAGATVIGVTAYNAGVTAGLVEQRPGRRRARATPSGRTSAATATAGATAASASSASSGRCSSSSSSSPCSGPSSVAAAGRGGWGGPGWGGTGGPLRSRTLERPGPRDPRRAAPRRAGRRPRHPTDQPRSLTIAGAGLHGGRRLRSTAYDGVR